MKQTFLLVHSQNDHYLVSSNTNELLDTSYTSSRELREQNHPFHTIILQL
jgi:hypothetical protein